MGTRTTLIEDLRKKKAHPKKQAIIDKALANVYHDFHSELASPKLQLESDLEDAGYPDLARKVSRGRYDDDGFEPTAEMMEAFEDPEVMKAMDELASMSGDQLEQVMKELEKEHHAKKGMH